MELHLIKGLVAAARAAGLAFPRGFSLEVEAPYPVRSAPAKRVII